MKKLHWLLILSCCLLAVGCARMGQPDGGWYDDTPPRVVDATPADKATGVKAKKINIWFNEFIKIQDAQNKVIVSPPQLEQPEIKDNGRRIIVELKDSLKENTTYTIDFGDAIVDNNESNPMGNYTYSFSTGDRIDTLEVSGYVLDAENLEPIKGIQVGLFDDLSDTVFKQKPMIRISRTDSRGHFTIKGVGPGTYRCYALKDADGDFVYNQKSEQLAFSHHTFEPSWKPDTRQDTIWRDSLHIDNILRVPYTHFLPDDITLLAFTAEQTDRYLLKNERPEPNKLAFYFTYGNPELPVIQGLNFESDSAFVLEANARQDTLIYWLRDTMLINQDTLRMEVQYLMSDTLGVLFQKTDTLELLPKLSYEKRMKEKQKEFEKWQKDQNRKKKRGESYDSIPPHTPLQMNISGSSIAPDQRVIIEAPEPLEWVDSTAIHLRVRVDSLMQDTLFTFRPVPNFIRRYEIVTAWSPGREYSLEIDSAAFRNIYGKTTNAIKQSIKVRQLEDFGTLSITVSGLASDSNLVVQLLDSQEKVVKQQSPKGGVVLFQYVTPSKYYLRAFVDVNGNGRWDTGDYDEDRQPEDVYYYTDVTECKAKWDIKRTWNLTATPRYSQKPASITKQKADQAKKLQNRNAQRAKQLGIQYIQDKTGIRL
jgi:hypothetical protein